MSESEHLRRKGGKETTGGSDEESKARGAGATHPVLRLQAQAGNQATGAVIRRYTGGATTYTEPDEAIGTYVDLPDALAGSDVALISPDSVEEEDDELETIGTDDSTIGAKVYGGYTGGGSTVYSSNVYSTSPDDFSSWDGLISPDSVEDEDDEDEVEVDATTSKHAADLPMNASHRGENISSGDFARMLYAVSHRSAPAVALKQARAELLAAHPGAEPRFIERMAARRAATADLVAFADQHFTTHFGWTQDEIDRHIHGDEPVAVTYLDEEARKEYALKGSGGNLTIGTNNRPADTSNMWSKHSGDGWGIFVMDGSGEIYAEAHKMGMFHHSSFMAGSDVASAGEIRIRNGTITGITNKSGHYVPTAQKLLRVFRELRDRGVDLRNVEFKDFQGNPVPGGAQAYLVKHDGPDLIDEDEDEDEEADLNALGIVSY